MIDENVIIKGRKQYDDGKAHTDNQIDKYNLKIGSHQFIILKISLARIRFKRTS